MLVHDLLDEKVGSMLVDAAMGVVSRSVAYRAGFKITDAARAEDAVAPVCPVLLVPAGPRIILWPSSTLQKLQQAFKHTATLRVDEGASTRPAACRVRGNQPVCRVHSIRVDGVEVMIGPWEEMRRDI